MILIHSSLLQSLAIIVGLILVCLLLRRKGIITENERPVLEGSVTDFALCHSRAWQARGSRPTSSSPSGSWPSPSSSPASAAPPPAATPSSARPSKDPATWSRRWYKSLASGSSDSRSVWRRSTSVRGEGIAHPGIRTFIKSPKFISLVLGLSYTLLVVSLKSGAQNRSRPLIPMLDAIGSALVIFVAMAIALDAQADTLRKARGLIVAVALIKPPRQALS